ncbi:PREDICTED: probable thionin-2.4 [Camelina sativa]|uniref:Probable thionin-2.4 n=1 Tax=Camelina sativa TaxID=90675 RepID=A0ABM0Y836_CAMSA|nr:PREDICTED: probable thionin-2.4 [Camelina sativa]XP_010497015.1 PREDICTED: probable thionin-2.4 [Camelina sativa]
MEGKTLVLSVLVMSLFMAQIQVDAKSCCPSTTARNIYNTCRFAGGSRPVCASASGCKIINSGKCPNGYTHDILENTGDAVNEYCKLGCVSSVCGALTTLQNSDASEIVNVAVEKCANACLTVCTKGSMIAVETA